MMGNSARAKAKLGMGFGVSLLAMGVVGGATGAFAQTAPSPCPDGQPGPVCRIVNDGAAGPISGNIGNALVINNSGTITGAPAINVGGAVLLNVVNNAGATIAGTGGTAIQLTSRAGIPLLNFGVINAGTIDGNVSVVEPTPAPPPAPGLVGGPIYYISNGGTLNGNLSLGTGFSLSYFLQRFADDGVTGTISAGNGVDIYARRYTGTQTVALGASPLPATFEIEGFEADGVDGLLTLTGAGTAINLNGNGNVVNEAVVNTLNTAPYYGGVNIVFPAIGYYHTGIATLPRPNPAPGTPALYTLVYGGALNSFVNNGQVNGDIRVATASFENAGEVNQLTGGVGSIVTTASSGDFLFRNSGSIEMQYTGQRASTTSNEAELDEGLRSAVRVRSALDLTDPGNAAIENSGQISGGLDVNIAADNFSFVNTGAISGANFSDYFARGLTLNIGELNLVVPGANDEFNGASATVLNDTGATIDDGASIIVASNSFSFENKGQIIRSGAEGRTALLIEHDLLEPEDGEGQDAAAFQFVNSGLVGGRVNIDTESTQASLTNSGTVLLLDQVIDQADPPLFGGEEAFRAENESRGDMTVTFANTGTIESRDKGSSGLIVELEAGDDDIGSIGNAVVNVSNSGQILASGGALLTPGQLIGQPQGVNYLTQVAALGVDVESTGSNVINIDNQAGGLIEASGSLNILIRQPNGAYAYLNPPVVTPSGTNMVAVGASGQVINITNSGTIRGGAGTDYSAAEFPPVTDNPLGQPNRYLAGAIHTSGDELDDGSFLASTDTVTNTASGVIVGSIDLGGGDDRIDNSGTITGDAFLREGNDIVVNRGAITGNVSLGAGDDRFTQFLTAQFTGLADGGAGNDTLEFDLSGSNGQFTQGFRDQFINFEVFSLVGTANQTVDLGGGSGGGGGATATPVVLGGDVSVAPGQTAINGGPEAVDLTTTGNIAGNVALGDGDNRLVTQGNVTGDIVAGAGNNNLSNSGTVTGNVVAGSGNNSFANGSTGQIVGNVTFGNGANAVNNQGAITGNVTFGDGGNSVSNVGTITGTVASGNGDDQFVNSGTVNGNVDLAGGSDSYVFGSGTVTGTVQGGSGSGTDSIVYNAPTGTQAAQGRRTGQAAQPGEVAVTAANTGNLQGFEQFVVNGPANIYADGTLGFGAFVLNGASLRVDGQLTTAGATSIQGSAGAETVTTSGTINGNVSLGDGGDAVVIQTGGAFTGTVDGGAGADALNLQTAGTEDQRVQIDGAGFANFEQLNSSAGVNAVNGALNLGTNGAVSVTGGHLIGNAGSTITGNVAVSGAGIFGSAGTVTGNVSIAAGGTLSPGASPAIMTINGNLAIGDGTTTTFEFVPVGQSDQIIVNGGSVTIGANTTINLTGSLTPGDSRDLIIVNGGGTISGSFTMVNPDAGVVGVLRYDSTVLQLLGTFVAPTGVSTNADAGIDYVNGLLTAGTASPALLAAVPSLLAGGNASAAAFSRINAEAYASASQLGVEQGLSIAQAGRSGIAATRRSDVGPFSFAQGLGDWRRLDGDGAAGTSRASSHSYGLIGGLGYGNENASVAAFIGYVDSRQTIAGLGARTNADGVVAGISGRYASAGFDVVGTIAYDWSDARTRRTVPGGASVSSSRYSLRSLVLDAVAGYEMPMAGDWAVRPEIGITHVSTRRGAASETGSATFALAVDRARTSATFIDGGVKLKGGMADGARFHPHVQLGVRHQLEGEVSRASAGFVGNAGRFTVLGAGRDETLVTAGAGASYDVAANASLFAAYLGEFGGGRSHNVNLGVRFGF